MAAKILPMQSEILHAPEGETRLAHVELLKIGRTVRVTAVADNGTTMDEVAEELLVYLAARNQSTTGKSPG